MSCAKKVIENFLPGTVHCSCYDNDNLEPKILGLQINKKGCQIVVDWRVAYDANQIFEALSDVVQVGHSSSYLGGG